MRISKKERQYLLITLRKFFSKKNNNKLDALKSFIIFCLGLVIVGKKLNWRNKRNDDTKNATKAA